MHNLHCSFLKKSKPPFVVVANRGVDDEDDEDEDEASAGAESDASAGDGQRQVKKSQMPCRHFERPTDLLTDRQGDSHSSNDLCRNCHSKNDDRAVFLSSLCHQVKLKT